MRILICTDGSPAAEQAAVLVSRLNYPKETEILLLAVSESDGDQPGLIRSLGRMESLLGGPRPELQRKIRYGNPGEQIVQEIEEQGGYQLVAIGARSGHRGLAGLRAGQTATKLTRSVRIPVLVARNVPPKLERILVCTAAEQPSEETLRAGGELVATSGAEIGLLHVMSQLALRLDSPPEDLLDTAISAIERRTREGQHLERATQLLRQAGVTGPIRPRLRHGLVVDQVLAELREGDYDLLVIGGHYQHNRSRWLEILLEDVAGQLLSNSPCSVLIV